MLKVWGFILVCYALVCHLEALCPEKCKVTPPEKHCLIEYPVRDRWPHQVRYVYNWYTKDCFEIRWSNHCPPVPQPTLSNNFPSKKACMDGCGGWA